MLLHFRLGLKDTVSTVNAYTFGHHCPFNGGLVLSELLCDVIYTALGYNKNCVFIDAICTPGIIPSTVMYVNHTPH